MKLITGFMLAIAVMVSGAQERFNPVGNTYYLNANMRYSHPQKIFSTNYHTGQLIPLGTKVEITGYKAHRKEGIIRFKTVDDNQKFQIIVIGRHSGPDTAAYFDHVFNAQSADFVV